MTNGGRVENTRMPNRLVPVAQNVMLVGQIGACIGNTK